MKLRRIALVGFAVLAVVVLIGYGTGCPGSGSTVESAGPVGATGLGGSAGSTGSGGSAGPSAPSAASEATVQLAATGQTTSYAAGDDGDLEIGETMDATQRFVDNGDGTVSDQLTGLMWLRDASCLIHHYEEWETDGYAEGWVPWDDAFLFIAQINAGTLRACAAGYNDWRLPNVVELESLINTEAAHPNEWLIALGFVGVEANDYWTATTYVNSPGVFAYVVDVSTGVVSALGNKPTAPAITSVWPVRGTTEGSTTELWKTGQTTVYHVGDDGDLQNGVAWPAPRFVDNGDGTITDNLTGLIWLQDADAFGVPSWFEAFIAVDRFNNDPDHFECENYTAAYTDWRLPNRKEIFSLADFSQHGPALQPDHPFIDICVTASYWSSSTYASDTERAWHVDLRSGEIGQDLKVNGRRLMLARSP